MPELPEVESIKKIVSPVFIGQKLDQSLIESMLDDCLLTDEEFVQGPAVWEKYDDPLQPVENGKEASAL